ncbi:hypothetical protein BCR32DRAFT_248414 [Anaeromyces robustus]|uniref:Uncharacterized protein n=1 Tax=Anaeromyces robustus TaxID=1754192 RepID=A0A1Y1WTU7_9FUNG|nr:hypothetical protein BCR32DRAFT_248414 [Anaeromyces robustus]|eukprot:ORX76825.1 hypothetical protein BCR32DRAFT_248414 [Anaeromyces robustus]
MELNYNSLSSISSLLQNPFEDPSLQTSLNSTTYYRSFDSIENLKIKAHLVKIADINHRNIFRNIRDVTNTNKDQYYKEVTIDDNNDTENDKSNNNNNNDTLSKIDKSKSSSHSNINSTTTSGLPPSYETEIRWQEKIFSPTEVFKYADVGTYPSAIERKHHLQLENILSDPKTKNIIKKRQLFTYVDADNHIDQDMLYPLIENMTNEEPVTKLAKRKLTVRDKKRHTSTNYEDEADRLIFPGVHNEQPGFYSSFREMHIMGYFERGEKDKEEKMLEILSKKKANLKKKDDDEDNKGNEEEDEEKQDLLLSLEKKNILTNVEEAEVNYVEKRLCTIRAYENGWISMTPAYNQKYRFTIGDYDVYEFSLENCSSQLTSQEEQKEWDLFETVDKKRMEIRNYIVGKNFQEIPEMLGFRIMIFGEIVSARKFEENSIYIQYSLELPKYWKKNDTNSPKQMLFGNTQSTDFIYDPPTDDYEARFAYPFEFDLLNAHYDPFIKWPVIYFHVCTKDKWCRNTTLGYGYYNIPWLPGHYDETINTWRAYPSISERMGQYFVGRTLTLEDITYVNFPKGFNKKYLNKYGFQTETSGSIRIRLNIVHQIGSFHLLNSNKDDNGFLKNNNLKEISDALLRARKRVEFLRQQQQNKKNN